MKMVVLLLDFWVRYEELIDIVAWMALIISTAYHFDYARERRKRYWFKEPHWLNGVIKRQEGDNRRLPKRVLNTGR